MLQAYVVRGALLLPVPFVFYMLGGFSLLVNLSAFLYPAYKSLQAITANDAAEDKQWLTYWVRGAPLAPSPQFPPHPLTPLPCVSVNAPRLCTAPTAF